MAKEKRYRLLKTPISNARELTCSPAPHLGYEGMICTGPPTAVELGEQEMRNIVQNAASGDHSTVIVFSGENAERARIVFSGGAYQLGALPIHHFQGVTLPPGSTIRFGNLRGWLDGLEETRELSITRGGNSVYAWDAHVPAGQKPHEFYHLNQKGMFPVFGRENHSPLTPTEIQAMKTLKVIRVGGRLFLVVGVLMDSASLGSALGESIATESVRPIAAESARVGSRWAGAWAGASGGVAFGAKVGIAGGPVGIAVCAIGGGVIGGLVFGLFGDWIGDIIEVPESSAD